MKPLYVKCPQCKESSELLLESEAQMIVLHCPSCNAALMYYYGKTFAIDSTEMDKIQGNAQMTTVKGILKNSGAQEGRSASVVRRTEVRASHQAGAPVRESPFAQDDITNLKIDLALAKDVNDFIKGM